MVATSGDRFKTLICHKHYLTDFLIMKEHSRVDIIFLGLIQLYSGFVKTLALTKAAHIKLLVYSRTLSIYADSSLTVKSQA